MSATKHELAVPYNQVVLARTAVRAAERHRIELEPWVYELAEAEPPYGDPPYDEHFLKALARTLERGIDEAARGRPLSRRRAERDLARALREADGEPRLAGWLGLRRRRSGG